MSRITFSIMKSFFYLTIIIIAPFETRAQDVLSEFDQHVQEISEICRDQVITEIQELVSSKIITKSQLFDTFYIPIPNTSPQKYKTSYDQLTDKYLQRILDRCLSMDKKFVFVIVVDKNGYVPTHNTAYSMPLTGNVDYDAKHNRTKRIFNDRTGLAAARNTKPYLLQNYSRDTGENMADFSVPIFIDKKHWGALRIGYFRDM